MDRVFMGWWSVVEAELLPDVDEHAIANIMRRLRLETFLSLSTNPTKKAAGSPAAFLRIRG